MTPILAAYLLISPALALDSSDRLVLGLAGGGTTEGWYLAAGADSVILTGPEGRVEVPLGILVSVRVDGQEMALDRFFAEAAAARAREEALAAVAPPAPHPALAAGLSVVWAGAGPASLGDWRGFAGWSLLEGALLGTAAWEAFGAEQVGSAYGLVALDAVVHGWAAAESASRARSRRAARNPAAAAANPPG